MTNVCVDSQNVCVPAEQEWPVEERLNEQPLTGKVRRKKTGFFRLFSKLFSRKKSAPSGPGEAVENREPELTELDETSTSENQLRILESELAENQQLVTDSSIEKYRSISENNRHNVDHAAYCKVTDDLRNDIEKLTSENCALKKPIEKFDKTTNTHCQTSNSTTQTVESSTSQDYDSPCDRCGFTDGSGDSKDTAGSVSVCNRCFVDRKTVDADMNLLKNELIMAKELLAEKEETLSDMGRRRRENERYFKTDMAELESKHAMAYELYKRCEFTNLNLEKELDAGRKREKKLEQRIEQLKRELKRKDDLIEYERNNVLSMNERKIDLNLSKKSSESKSDKSTNKTAMEQIKTEKMRQGETDRTDAFPACRQNVRPKRGDKSIGSTRNVGKKIKP